MKLSVVIPAYNEERLLPRCLESLRKQNFPKSEYEVIVVDNGSLDKTSLVAKLYGAKVVFEPKRGIAYARQKGVEESKGEIIVGIDADCEVPQNFLKNVVACFKDKKVGGVCGTIYLDEAPILISLGARIISEFAHYYSKKKRLTPVCWALNFSFRKDVFDEVGGYELDLPMLLAGYNTQGGDEYKLVKKIAAKKMEVIFNKNIYLKTSGRRFKNRLLYWFLVEYLLGFVVNEKIYNKFGFLIPMTSYYERIVPKNFYRRAYLLILTMILITSVPWLYLFIQSKNPASLKNFPETAQKEFKKLLTVRFDLQNNFSEFNFTGKITPYLPAIPTKNPFE